MREQIVKFSHQGNWAALLPLLRHCPDLVNVGSATKGYTALHQAAWHGANLAVVGELLAMGANPASKTHNKQQTAQEIATEKHPDRKDLEYILTPRSRTLAQLMRKVVADTPDLFVSYDGNQMVCDRLIECFGSDTCQAINEDVEERFDAAFRSVTGFSLSPGQVIRWGHLPYEWEADTDFWQNRFLPLLRVHTARAPIIPIEPQWAMVSDLFDPAPGFGLRGDMFLWIEMSQALCHVEIPEQPEELEQIIASAFTALTGKDMTRSGDFYVSRFARGGMSSGMVCSDYWSREIIPLLQARLKWLQEAWRC
jgi:hypothetical protein